MLRPPPALLIGFVLVGAFAALLVQVPPLRMANLAMFDAESSWLRRFAPTVPAQDVVLVGVDEQTYETIAEPYALWHTHLGKLFSGLASAKPAAVGLAMPLPVRSYDFVVKGIDAPLVDGLKQLSRTASLVVGRTAGVGTQLRPIAPELLAAAGGSRFASLTLCQDADGIVRRVEKHGCAGETSIESFAFVMAEQMGRAGLPGGYIDYSVGGAIDYVPLMHVLEAIDQGRTESLRERFTGRVVMIATLLPGETRFRLPVKLAAWDLNESFQPRAVAHIQALRTLLERGPIEPIEGRWKFLLMLLSSLFWFGRNGWAKGTLFGLALLAVLGGSTFALWHGTYLPTADLLLASAIAFTARLVYESLRHYREKQALRLAFAGHVSPQVMRSILRGRLQPDADGERCHATVLFADIRNFTTRSASATPEAMIELLNRFYGEATAAIHAKGGAIDKYIGDGLMATFGVPQPLPAPERNALEAAQDMLVRIDRLNAHLQAEGVAPLEIGIGIHSGEVLAGYLGSKRRRDFTVIGDTVNTASRLEGLTKEVGYPIVCSEVVASAVHGSGGLTDLGEQKVKGRAPVRVWGWNPPLHKRARGRNTP